MDEQAPQPKDAGLFVMLLLVVAGTLLMAWVADQPATRVIPAAIADAPESEALGTGALAGR